MTKAQIDWTKKKCEELVLFGINRLPLDDVSSLEVKSKGEDIVKISKYDLFVKKMVLETLVTINRLDKVIREEFYEK